jgi:DNA-binding NarL/FixJ family response regulator
MREDGRSESVLIVDPHGLLDEPARSLDRAASLDARSAATLDAAVRLAETSSPDAVVLALVLTGDHVVSALRVLASSSNGLPPELAAALHRAAAGAAECPLTPREREVLTMIAGGHTNREVAAALSISQRTVETHRAHIVEKLGARTRAELVRGARELGLTAS